MAFSGTLDTYMALVYFHAYMYGPLQGKARLYRDRGIRTRVAMSEDWEVFASILVRDTGTSTRAGLDLQGYEVKSALDGSSFEYQYHRRSWAEKLAADRTAGHIFISHRDALQHVDVRYCDGGDLSQFFDIWESERPYSSPSAQRFRRTVPYRWVKERGTLLLQLVNGEPTSELDTTRT